MARKHDSGWRDGRLNLVHAAWDVPFPATGMTFPTIEYDRGEPLAVINYLRRDVPLPVAGADTGRAYYALSDLHSAYGTNLPFLTVQYDPRNWAMRLFGHNDAARDLIGASGWVTVTEEHFVRQLYRIRGRHLPTGLDTRGVKLSTAPWIQSAGAFQAQGWPGQDMSVRRRAYEPEGNGVRFSHRNPCADIDLAVIGARSGQVSLLVDYKLTGAHIDPTHKTHQAMSQLIDGNGNQVPSLIARYEPSDGPGWRFDVLPLNASAQALLYRFMVRTRALAPGHGSCDTWTYVDEPRWVDFLREAQQQ